MPEGDLERRLRAHVIRLAGEIGERNVWRPRALHAAADYIRDEWLRQGHSVTAQRYTACEVPSENLEIALAGTARAAEIMVTDTAFYRYPHYHTAQDTPDRIDYARMAQVVEGLANAILLLASDEERR